MPVHRPPPSSCSIPRRPAPSACRPAANARGACRVGPRTTREPASYTTGSGRQSTAAAMSASALASPQAVAKPGPAIWSTSARQNPASRIGAAPLASTASVCRGAVAAIRRPPRDSRTPVDTTRAASSASTTAGTTAAMSSVANHSNGRSVQPGVAFQPAASTCTTLPRLDAIPRLVQATSREPRGACTNVTSSRMFHGSS